MTSIDELFKKPSLPSKRKLEISHDPSHFYKSAKHTAGSTASGAHPDEDDDVEAGPTVPGDDDDDAYGPAAPPEDDAPEDNDDEDGRFFGDGVGRATKAALAFVDAQDGSDAVETKAPARDAAWLRRIGVSFERRISRNAELRAKHADDPARFVASEADLDAAIRELSDLAGSPALYPEFARLGCAASLVGLAAHENLDIAIDALEIVAELLDEDVGAEEEQWGALVDAAVEADLLGLVEQNLRRLDEREEADRGGVYTALSILESLASKASLADKIGTEGEILAWLLKRAQAEEKTVSQNKQYAAEMLSVLAQQSSPSRLALIKLDAVDTILQLLAPYRRNDPPKDSEEDEWFENLFDAVTCLMDEPAGIPKFVEAEGVELALIMLRDGKSGKSRALRMLDHAMSGSKGAAVCTRLVEAQGLKTVFGVFMKQHDSAMTEHFLGVFASLLRNLPADSAERIRTLAKFVEKSYEKVAKLVALRRTFAPRVATVSKEIEGERKKLPEAEREEREVEWLTRRLDAGLYSLQTVDIILAWLSAEDSGAKKEIKRLLAERDERLADVKATLQDQYEGVVDTDEEAQSFKDMLETLISLL
jgi:beta-catenin-like protein 1